MLRVSTFKENMEEEMIGILMKVVTDIKLATIAMMSIMLIALVVGNYKLEDSLNEANIVVNEQKLELVNCEIRSSVLENANAAAIATVSEQVKVVEKKVVEIKKVYVPQIEYIDRYVGDRNETNCDSSTKLITNFVY